MMSILRNIYRKNFCSVGKRLLLELFEAQPSSISGLVLQEAGLPAGNLTIYQWWKDDGGAYFQKSERNLRTALSTSEKVVERQVTEFDNLIELITQADQPHLESFAGVMKDGVVFAIAWGNPRKLRHLSFKNPFSESPENGLVRTIKANEWEKL